MPGYKAHLAGGAVAYGLTLYLLRGYCSSVFLTVEWLFFALAGSLFPDIDTKSKGQTFFYRILFIVLILLALQRKFFSVGVLSVFAIVPIISRHRGLFHKFWFVVGVSLVGAIAVSLYVPEYCKIIMFDTLFFIVGIVSHLILDLGFRRAFKV